MSADLLRAHDVALVRADNPSPMTLSGTNTWLAGRDPCWVVDPGPALEAHVTAVLAEAATRGGIGGIALTHGHPDHTGAVAVLAERAGGVEVGAASFGAAGRRLADGDRAGPLETLAVPGHATDHLCFAFGAACFTGDAVLGEGSVFLTPDPGALGDYLDGLRRLRARDFAVLLPGHGPVIADANAKLDGYIAHRLERERALISALEDGVRSVDGLLDAAWSDVPEHLRWLAAVTLTAHLDKLEQEGRLPGGVHRPSLPLGLGGGGP
jgi:glyoxylase-like metal-dependent hydrolase (beta-lactamase superfamily II)